MPKTSLIDRMRKAGAPKTWIREVERMMAQYDELEAKKDEYGDIIDALARQLDREEEELGEFERIHADNL